VNPCCFTIQEAHQFGDLRHDDLATIWNNERYRGSRALFGRGPSERAGTLCDDCLLYKRPGTGAR
jgi:hypothetical protein